MSNFRFVIGRFLGAIPTLLILICLAFLLVKSAPGGPFDFERSLPEEVEANLRAAYNLDDPVYLQLFKYIGDLLQGDFGPSFQYRDYTVTELIATGFPVSLRLGTAAIFLALIFGSIIGSVAALNQNSKLDYGVMFFSRIEIESSSFTNYHFKQNLEYKIKLANKYKKQNLSDPLLTEVKNHLVNILNLKMT